MARNAVAARLISDIRRRGDLSQAELARRAGMPRSVINTYERGHRQPSAEALARIAAAAGLELVLRPIIRPLDDRRAGRILSQVLDLAEQLPGARGRRLRFPPFASRVRG